MGKDERGAICPGLGTSPQRVILPSVPHLLPIGFGTAGRRRSWRQASYFGRPHPGTMGGIIPESLGESTKAEPRLSDDEPGLLMSRGGLGAWGPARQSCKS